MKKYIIILIIFILSLFVACDFFPSLLNGDKTITLISPIEADEWGKGLEQEIKWSNTGYIENVKIEVLDGFDYTTIIESVENTGTYSWDVPSTFSDGNYKIKVSDADFPTLIFSESKAFSIISTSDIRVTEDSTDITNSSSYNLGVRAIGDQNQFTFTIENNGVANLELTGNPMVSISGTDSTMFSVISYPDSQIGPDETTSFTIQFNPSSIGEKTADISIENNIEAENPFNFTLSSKAFEPGIVVAGYKRSTGGTSDYDWLIKKYNKNSTEDFTNWNKDFSANPGVNYYDRARGSAADSQNNVYVVGDAYNAVSGGTYYDWWIKKFDVNGEEDTTNWNKVYHGGYREDYAFAVEVDSNDNVYVVGNRRNPSNSYRYDWWIKKFDSDGNEDTTNWDITIKNTTGHDYAYAVAIDSNNNVYVGGYKYYGSSHFDWWIKKFDENGNEDTTNWNKEFAGTNRRDVIKSIVIDQNDDVYAIGYKQTTSSKYVWWIKKFDSNGNEDTINWNKEFSNSSYVNQAHGGAIDSNNNLYVVGNKSISNGDYDWWIKKFDENGNEDTTNWDITRNLGAYRDYLYDVSVDKDDNVYVVGGKYAGNNYDWRIEKYDSNGNRDLNWDKNYDSELTGHDAPFAVVVLE